MCNSIDGRFITGSDTGVGKTWVAVKLISSWLKQGKKVKVRKPVESGVVGVPEDAYALQVATISSGGVEEPLEVICPYRFKAAISPERAAQLEGKEVTTDQLLHSVTSEILLDEFLVVEGAGGFYSPLTSDGLNSDLAIKLGLPVILVVADKLGAINHTILTVEAILSSGLEIDCIVLNKIPDHNQPKNIDNLIDLQRLLPKQQVVTIT